MVVLRAGGEKGAVNSCLTAVLCMLSLETSTILDAWKAEISALNSHFMLYICDNNWQLLFHFVHPLFENLTRMIW